MGKIWLKSTDPNKQCCGCEGKSGPCSSCCTPASGYLFTDMYLSGVFKDKLMKAAWTGGLPIVGTEITGALVFSNTGTKLTFISSDTDSAQMTPFAFTSNPYWGWPNQILSDADRNTPPHFGMIPLVPFRRPVHSQIKFTVNEGEYIRIGTTIGPKTINTTNWTEFFNITAMPGMQGALCHNSRKEAEAFSLFGGDYRLYNSGSIIVEEFYSGSVGVIETSSTLNQSEYEGTYTAVSGLLPYYNVLDEGGNPAYLVEAVCRGLTVSGTTDSSTTEPFNTLGDDFYGPDASGYFWYDVEHTVGEWRNYSILVKYLSKTKDYSFFAFNHSHGFGLSPGSSPFYQISPSYSLSTLVADTLVIEKIYPGNWNVNPAQPPSFLSTCYPDLPTFDGDEPINIGVTGYHKFKVTNMKKHYNYSHTVSNRIVSVKTMCATFEGTPGSFIELFDTGNKPIPISTRLRPYQIMA